MNTMIISAFPACGKTYLYNNQDTLKFKYQGKDVTCSICDIDTASYKKIDGWADKYVSDIVAQIGKVDFILVSHFTIPSLLNLKGIPYVSVVPCNDETLTQRERSIIKQQWFGRIVLRDNSFMGNGFEHWFIDFYDNWDKYTSLEFIKEHKPVNIVSIRENQYLSDIIKMLYDMKESNPEKYCLDIDKK